MLNFWQLATNILQLSNSTISFDYSWSLAKYLSNFVFLPLKLHNLYCHKWHIWGHILHLCSLFRRFASFGLRRPTMIFFKNLIWIIASCKDQKFSIYRGFSPYATFGTWKKFALAINRISKIFILCTQ